MNMMKITIKRILGIIGLLMAIGFGVFVYGGWQMLGDELKAIKSLKIIKDRVYTLESEEGIQALKEASYEEETLWSVIYNKEELSSTIYFDRIWDEPLSFRIKD
jgi:hypothetical protein